MTSILGDNCFAEERDPVVSDLKPHKVVEIGLICEYSRVDAETGCLAAVSTFSVPIISLWLVLKQTLLNRGWMRGW